MRKERKALRKAPPTCFSIRYCNKLTRPISFFGRPIRLAPGTRHPAPGPGHPDTGHPGARARATEIGGVPRLTLLRLRQDPYRGKL